MKEENQAIAAIAFATGVIIAANWKRIRNVVEPVVKPVLTGLGKASTEVVHRGTKLAMEVKEGIEDKIAEAKLKKEGEVHG